MLFTPHRTLLKEEKMDTSQLYLFSVFSIIFFPFNKCSCGEIYKTVLGSHISCISGFFFMLYLHTEIDTKKVQVIREDYSQSSL